MNDETFPDEWIKCTLQDAANWGTGGTPSRKNKEYYGGKIPWVKTGDLGPKFLLYPKEFISEIGFENSNVKFFPKGSVAVAMYGATIGKTSILGIDATTNQACAVGNPKKEITNSIFLYYTLLNEKNSFVSKAFGGAQPNISQSLIREHPIPLPPLAEQKVIADKLDTLLAQVESTKSRLERIPTILKRFRQSVLSSAVSGKLTENWRKENECDEINSADLIAHKNELIKNKTTKKDLSFVEVFNSIPTPSNWNYHKLKSLAWKITDGEHKTPKRESQGRFLLSARNVRDGYISTENVDYVGEEEFTKLRKRCDPNKGDILISCSGSVGRVSLVDEDDKYVMVRSAALVKVMENFLNSRFLMFMLQSPTLQKGIEESSKSTAQSNLFLGPIKDLEIPLPPLPEQQEIVQRVEELFAYADRIESQTNAALDRVNNLTQSILAKAFRGELTAEWRINHSELITGENSSVALLEKIQAGRATQKPTKKMGTKRKKK